MTQLSTTPPAQPETPIRPHITAIDVLAFLCELFAVLTFAIWGFSAWAMPWSIVAGIGTPVVAIAIWALFVSPRALVRVHPFVRALVELLVYAGATVAWWSGGQLWVGIVFAVVAVIVGAVAGSRRLG